MLEKGAGQDTWPADQRQAEGRPIETLEAVGDGKLGVERHSRPDILAASARLQIVLVEKVVEVDLRLPVLVEAINDARVEESSRRQPEGWLHADDVGWRAGRGCSGGTVACAFRKIIGTEAD